MNKLTRSYPNKRHSVPAIKKALEVIAPSDKDEPIAAIFSIEFGCLEDFLKAYQAAQKINSECFVKMKNGASISLKYRNGHTEVVAYTQTETDSDRLAELLD